MPVATAREQRGLKQVTGDEIFESEHKLRRVRIAAQSALPLCVRSDDTAQVDLHSF